MYSTNLTYENNCPQTYMSLTIQQNVEFNLDIYWYDQTTLDNKILNYIEMNDDILCNALLNM